MTDPRGSNISHSQEKNAKAHAKEVKLAAGDASKTQGEEPDKSLQSWSKTVKDRKYVSSKLTLITKRSPADLVMNTVDQVREIKEQKAVLEHCQIQKKPELRGGIWEQPPRLRQTCECQPIYEVHRTKVDLGEIPEMEYVAVPEYILKKEKGMVGTYTRHPCKEVGFVNSKYRMQREKELSADILRIEPHRPNLKGKMVKGNKPRPPPPSMPVVPDILVTEHNTHCSSVPVSVYALRINNTVLLKEQPNQCLEHLLSMKNEPWHERKTTWTYYFNAPITKISKNQLTLTNLGTVTLKYCWQPVKPARTKFSDTDAPVFFFCKNEDVLSPGQTRNISLLFISTVSGIFEESWLLQICNEEFFNTYKLTIALIADAVESDLDAKQADIDKINNILSIQECDFNVRGILDDILSKAMVVPPEKCPYEQLLMEEHIFLMKNPNLYYHQTEIEKLKLMYTTIVKTGQTWDLSIRTLKKAIIPLEYSERTEKYEMLKKHHVILLKPWKEELPLTNQKHAAMKQQLTQFVDMFYLDSTRLKRELCRGNKGTSGDYRRSVSKREQVYRELLHMTMQAHLADAVEIGAALLSSLDLFRWLEFES